MYFVSLVRNSDKWLFDERGYNLSLYFITFSSSSLFVKATYSRKILFYVKRKLRGGCEYVKDV